MPRDISAQAPSATDRRFQPTAHFSRKAPTPEMLHAAERNTIRCFYLALMRDVMMLQQKIANISSISTEYNIELCLLYT